MSFRDSKRLETAIDSARDEAASPQLSEENRARLAQLMTVWASGYLEAVCRDAVLAYTENRAHPTVVNFVSRSLNRFQNPRMENILTLVRGIDGNIADDLGNYADGSIKESVSSIVGMRHLIAHGRSANISVGQVTQYFEDAKRLARKMEDLLQ